MWTRAAISLALLAVTAAGCVEARIDFHDVVDAQGVTLTVIESRNGSVEVNCDPALTSADISGTKYARAGSLSDARAEAEQIRITAHRDAGRPEVLHITAVFPIGQMNSGASFRVKLPAATDLEINTGNGAVVARDVGRNVNVHTGNGSVHLDRVGGRAKAETSNGSITLSDVAGDVDVVSSNGSIHLENVGRERVSARTSNGRIRALGVRGIPILRTSNGSIELSTDTLPDRPKVQAVSSNGSVHVTLPSTLKAEVRLQTSNGGLHADFASAQVTGLESSRHSLKAVLNGGGGLVEVETSNSSLSFSLTEAAGPAK